jgi:hypothetical protein
MVTLCKIRLILFDNRTKDSQKRITHSLSNCLIWLKQLWKPFSNMMFTHVKVLDKLPDVYILVFSLN